MSEIEVRPAWPERDGPPKGPHEYDVTVSGDGSPTEHHVTVPDGLLEGWGLADDAEETVVRESFVFLLEREPARSIMEEFSLSVIPRYFPEYEQELPRRVSGR